MNRSFVGLEGKVVADRYAVDQLLYVGATSYVYRGTVGPYRRDVVLKELHPEHVKDARRAERFRAEAHALSLLKHPHVVDFVDLVQHDKCPIIVVERIRGPVLAEKIALYGRLTPERAAKIVVQTLSALTAAHDAGILHRDVRPHNIVSDPIALRGADVVKLIDFGSAWIKQLDDEPKPVHEKELGSGRAFMPPECARGAPYDHRSEIYAVAATLYLAITGIKPNSDPTPVGPLESVLRRAPETIEELGLDIDRELCAIVSKGLAENPDDRYESAKEMLFALEQWLEERMEQAEDACEQLRTGRIRTGALRATIRATPSGVVVDAEAVPEGSGGHVERPATDLVLPPMDRAMPANEHAPPANERGMPEHAPRGAASPETALHAPVSRRRKPHTIALAAAAALALGCAGWAATKRHAPPAPVVAAPAASADVGSTNAGAIAAYRAGVDAIRNAAGGTARRNFDRAITLDPAFAAAHLRKVLATPWVGEAERESLRKATQLRVTLSDHDRALLHAIEPWVAVPQDAHEVERRLTELASSQEEPELYYQLCRFRVLDGNYARAADACRAARELDQGFAGAYWLEGQTALFLNDTAAGIESLHMCLRLSAAATSCLNDLLQIEMNDGQCDAAASDAQQLVAIAPDAASMEDLAISSFATGKPLAVAGATYERAADLLSAERAPVERANFRTKIAALAGDFGDAARYLDEWEHVVAASTDEATHVDPFLKRTWLLRELGRDAEIVAASRAAISARAALVPTPELDLEITANVALYRAGAMTREEFVAARGIWIATAAHRPWVSGAAGFGPIRRWIAGYAEAAKSGEDARDALATLPQYLPLPSNRVRSPVDDEALGRTYLLAGRAAEAIPFLQRVARSCRVTSYPFHHTWANLDLGTALESTDLRGACDAYRIVLDRWGSIPESRSAAVARARRSVLGCK